MTPHDAYDPTNLHFLSFSGVLADARKRAVFPRVLPMKTGMWLGAELNRRHNSACFLWVIISHFPRK